MRQVYASVCPNFCDACLPRSWSSHNSESVAVSRDCWLIFARVAVAQPFLAQTNKQKVKE